MTDSPQMDTINRLLRKQAPKRRGRAAAAEATDTTPAEQEAPEPERPDPLIVRWVSNSNGCRVSVPQEWLGTPAGRMFGPPIAGGDSKMVEEL